ncbi:P-loop containing nucleoside triphosphate hydrolase protein [Epithele typhae]|uniref:P-loop containing nucleoside triphosphate hydrolase protein n=1 Tax=Epithele typhae TaxID=378194 RepID=UPI0020078B9B|nr:P-loop containing nucleoside triphosphate hydrolase protein [Epithele typhae]KAH9932077.1 P-loop containing nucleoside triphosphate hydrolase protein [Epithele typhae]
MPPKRGIVKSGNAGNSSKPSKAPVQAATTAEEKPLFPPGSKYPLSLLHERCQKNGWEKPIVDTRRQADGYSFVVTLSRMNKKSSEREFVRLEPHPPFIMPTALEARHWGATYAMYRFCNTIQLNRVLPPGPREYWNQLASEHKTVPEHQKWMYDVDPFAARKAVNSRQDQAAQKREQASRPQENSVKPVATSPEFANAPEAKMASSLRDFVEDALKKGLAMYPDADDAEPTKFSAEDHVKLTKDLTKLGFSSSQTRKAVTALSQQGPITANLLSRLPPLQACIEFLILQTPECDLPKRFLPSFTSSDPFVTAMHSGADDLKRRWIEEKAMKECGWPAHVVKECLADQEAGQDWAELIFALDSRLVGADWQGPVTDETQGLEEVDLDEVESFGGQMGSNGECIIPLPVAPMALHIILPDNYQIATAGTHPPMYFTSPTVAAYVRLHILSRIINAFRTGALLEDSETVIMAIMRIAEEEWAIIEDDGPPNIVEVLQHLLPKKTTVAQESGHDIAASVPTRSPRKRVRGARPDERSDKQVKATFEELIRRTDYSKMLASREKLPAFASRNEFLTMLQRSRCVIVVGETGCGKTTQLPQFVLDQLITANRGSRASIIVTQPRRLSAIGVAARVSAERLEDGSVGYSIRGESKQSTHTKILFCTTGVVLRRLGSGDKLQEVTHVVVDEVHERSVDGDFLLLELRELLKTHSELKVVLMSATINHEVFVKYFNNAPLLTIPGFTHPVEDIYLEDLLPKLSYRPSSGRSQKQKKGSDDELPNVDEDVQKAAQIIMRNDFFDFDLIVATVDYIVANAKKRGAILIFLSGVQEIRQCMDRLRSVAGSKVFPLHANLTSDEQRKVFERIPQWKIIVSTNVAETSVTIDDVIYVIDGGKVKETHYDADAGLTKLTEQWVTRAAAKQRRGRAGRTQPGICYKLYTRAKEKQMNAFPPFLARAVDPPEITAIDNALEVLEELSAISGDGELTALGRHMAMLPMDLRLGKMLVLGTVFRCLGPVLTVAACLSSKPLFMSPMDKREEANQARARFNTANSDLLTDVNAYEECLKMRNDGASHSAIRAFCDQNFISATTIRDITSLRNDFLSSLADLGFVPAHSKPSDPALNAHSAQPNLVKAVILGGVWPRVARVHLPKSAIKFDRVQAGTVQRENTAKEYKMYDLREGRVFVHPGSVLFNASSWKSPFLAYFQKQMTSKVFLRDATEVPIYALLLFGGPVTVNHIGGGLTVGVKDTTVRIKAWPRIGVLVNHLRRLLDAQLLQCIEEGTILDMGAGSNPVLEAIQALLDNDGLSS